MDTGYLQETSTAHTARTIPGRWVSGLVRIIDLWQERHRQRRELLDLAEDPDLLRDVGLSRYDVLQEGGKPFWRE
ncbi:MAG: DUF1127 domain-containing protein [Granulosicoccus sp.]|nr:DUF1127 domain-containing protein [Granulosicoccus sp.]